jgi:signal transduction histidine kinase
MITRLKDWLQRYSIGFAWSMAFAALFLKAILSYLNLQNVAHSADLVTVQHEVLLELESVLSEMKDAERSGRGFVITGNPDYRVLFERSRTELPKRLQRLETHFQDNPTQLNHLRSVRESVNKKLDEVQQVINLRGIRGFEAAQRRVMEDSGKPYMDAVSTTIAEMEARERELLYERRAEAARGREAATMILLAGTGVLILLTVTAFFVVSRHLAYQRTMESRLTQSNEELEQRVLHRTDALRATNETLQLEIEERERLEEQAKQSAVELQRSNRELEQFAFVASHDLQEPLRKIQAFSDRLKTKYGEKLDEQGQDYVVRIVSSASRMRRLIEDLLTFSRVSTKPTTLAVVDLNRVVQDVLSDLEGRLLESGGKVEVGPLPSVTADGPQMGQLFQNLIGNGLKFRRPGVPLVVKVASRPLPAEGEAEECHEITVSDNGIGFESAYAERIFQLFQRLHGRHEYEGTGMGLAICRKIVERHGGSIRAEGKPGEGATFTITLPTRLAMPQE